MTPSAVTPAARRDDLAGPRGRVASARPASPHPSAPRSAHRTPLRRAPAPRSPRRVSGPARPAPARSAQAARQTPQLPLSARALGCLRALPEHSLLDRVVRGRLWIPLLGVLLVGIVAMQVEVLKLNAGIGHSMVRAGELQTANQQLRASVSSLSDDQRIESTAARMGMVMASPTSLRFLPADGSANLPGALAGIHAPNAAGFAAATSANAAAAAAAASTTTAGPTTPTTPGG